jgi:hypothetical protein
LETKLASESLDPTVRLVLDDEVLAESAWHDEAAVEPVTEDEGSADLCRSDSTLNALRESSNVLDNVTQDHIPSSPGLKWSWYIYEPVIIVPLICAIGGKHLGILLSRGISGSKNKGIMFRLHSPSLVCLDLTLLDMSSPLRTTYVYATAKYDYSVNIRNDNALEVRVGQLVASGYTVSGERGLDWAPDAKNSRLTWIYKSDTPLLIFTHKQPGWQAFFIQVDLKRPLIGFFDHTSFLGLDRNLKHIDMTNASHAEIPVPGGFSIVLRARKLIAVQYLTLSMERTCHSASGASWMTGNALTAQEKSMLKMRLQKILDAANTGDEDLLTASSSVEA